MSSPRTSSACPACGREECPHDLGECERPQTAPLSEAERAEFQAVAKVLGDAERVYAILRGLEWYKRGNGQWDVVMRSLKQDRAHELHELVFGDIDE